MHAFPILLISTLTQFFILNHRVNAHISHFRHHQPDQPYPAGRDALPLGLLRPFPRRPRWTVRLSYIQSEYEYTCIRLQFEYGHTYNISMSIHGCMHTHIGLQFEYKWAYMQYQYEYKWMHAHIKSHYEYTWMYAYTNIIAV